jgi:hypothetical protein
MSENSGNLADSFTSNFTTQELILSAFIVSSTIRKYSPAFFLNVR